MAVPQYSVDELIDNIKRRCGVPTSQLTYQPADFTALANDELQGEVVPMIMSAREEYFVDYIDVLVSGNEIEIPAAAAGQKLRTVAFVAQASPLILINMPRIDLDVVAGIGSGLSNSGSLAGFYVQGNKLILDPPNSVPQNATIRLFYYKRTLVLASPDQFGQVVSIDQGASSAVLSFVPYDWDTGDVLNSVSSTSPFGVTNSALTIVSVSSPSVVFDTVEDLAVGDYISYQGYSAVPQVLIEAHGYLAQLTAVKCLEGLGDRQGMEAAQVKADMLKKNLLIIVSQRVDGSVKKIINPNGGFRVMGRRGYGGWF